MSGYQYQSQNNSKYKMTSLSTRWWRSFQGQENWFLHSIGAIIIDIYTCGTICLICAEPWFFINSREPTVNNKPTKCTCQGFNYYSQTRMHSSRMRTALFSCHLGYGGVCPVWGLLGGVYLGCICPRDGCLLGGLPRGMSSWGVPIACWDTPPCEQNHRQV